MKTPLCLSIATFGLTAHNLAAQKPVWSALGEGVNTNAYALAADGAGHLFVGGDFSLAGTQPASFIAQVNTNAAGAGGRFGGLAYSPATGFS